MFEPRLFVHCVQVSVHSVVTLAVAQLVAIWNTHSACRLVIIFSSYQRKYGFEMKSDHHRKTRPEIRYRRSYRFIPLWEWKKLRFSLSFSGILIITLLDFIVRH